MLRFPNIISSDIVQLMNYIGFATWFSIGAAVACIPYLRWKHPELERPIKVNLAFPIIFILMTLAITILPMIQQPVETAIGFAMILSAIPVYFIFIKWKSKPAPVQNLLASVNNKIQQLLIVIPPKKQE